jgi:hypothetical protein
MSPKFMLAETALTRLIEDSQAPVKSRCEALRQLQKPSISMLRRLLVQTAKRKKPVPARLRALAALRYAEVRRAKDAASRARTAPPNALGV